LCDTSGMPRPGDTVKVLLKDYGRTLAEDLGVDSRSGEPQSLFCILIAALLLNA